MSSQGRVIAITGASSGLGREIALQFGRQGARLALTARTQKAVDEVARQVQELGAEAFALSTDVQEIQQCERFIQETVSRYGQLDVLVNNAGIGVYGLVEELRPEDFEEALAVNYKGAVYCTLAAYREMRKQGQGHIINLASIAGKIGLPGESAYVAAKHALVGFAQSLKKEALRHNIRVDTICPGGMKTPFWEKVPPQRRPDTSKFLDPAAVAQLVVFLASTPEDIVFEDIVLHPRDEYIKRFA